jgi:hypothetical protein
MSEAAQMHAWLMFAHLWPVAISLAVLAVFWRRLASRVSFVVVATLTSLGIANVSHRLSARYLPVRADGSLEENLFNAQLSILSISQSIAFILGVAFTLWLIRFFKGTPSAL